MKVILLSFLFVSFAQANVQCKSKLTVDITDIITQNKTELKFKFRILKNEVADNSSGKCNYDINHEETIEIKPRGTKNVMTNQPTEILLEETSKLTETGFKAVKIWKLL